MRKIVILGIALILNVSLLGGCQPKTKVRVKGEEIKKSEVKEERVKKPKAEGEGKTLTLTLYFGDYQSFSLLPEKREIPKTSAVAEAAIEELIKGPQEEGHFSTLPPGTKLLGVSLEDSLARLNLSGEFVKNHPGGSAAERITIYSVVNTLTEFPTIKRVKFLVAGEEVGTLGHLDLTEPLERDEEIIQK